MSSNPSQPPSLPPRTLLGPLAVITGDGSPTIGPSESSLVGLLLSDAHSARLADALARNTVLTSLDLRGNALGEAVVRALAGAVERQGLLRRLELSFDLGAKLAVGDEVVLSADLLCACGCLAPS